MSQRQTPERAPAPIVLFDEEPTHVDDPPGFDEEEPSHTAPDFDDEELPADDEELDWPLPDEEEDEPVRH